MPVDPSREFELERPRDAVQNAGTSTELLSLESGEIQAMNHDIEPGDKINVDKPISRASAEDYDALILPGATVNADTLRVDEDVISFLQAYFQTGKPVGVFCHGPHAANIEQSFKLLGEDVDDSPCPVIETMAKEGRATIKKTDDSLIDAIGLVAATESEHYEIAGDGGHRRRLTEPWVPAHSKHPRPLVPADWICGAPAIR